MKSEGRGEASWEEERQAGKRRDKLGRGETSWEEERQAGKKKSWAWRNGEPRKGEQN